MDDRTAAALAVARRWLASPLARAVGTALGIALVLGAVWVALRQASIPALRADRETARHLVVLLLTTIIGLLLSAEVLLRLTRRFGFVGRGEMLGLVTAATLLNYLPLRPGLLGRAAWHRLVNDIPTSLIVRTVIEAAAITIAAVTALIAALLLANALSLSWMIAAGLPALLAVGLSLHPRLRDYALPMALRHAELLVWSIRCHAAFAIVGAELSGESALAMATVGVGASMIPFVGNGLGVREWTIGLLAQPLAGVDLATGVAADLAGRAVEIALFVPMGVIALLWLTRRRSHALRSLRSGPDPAP